MAIKIAKVTTIGATTVWDTWDASHATLENLGTRVSTREGVDLSGPFQFLRLSFFRGYVLVRFRASPNFH